MYWYMNQIQSAVRGEDGVPYHETNTFCPICVRFWIVIGGAGYMLP
jgi:hypothetical protein